MAVDAEEGVDDAERMGTGRWRVFLWDMVGNELRVVGWLHAAASWLAGSENCIYNENDSH